MARTSNERRHDTRKSSQPVADALALIGEGDNQLTLELAAVWTTERGNLSFRFHLFPLQWLDPNCKRVVVIKMRGSK
jgi:hypothetical protein